MTWFLLSHKTVPVLKLISIINSTCKQTHLRKKKNYKYTQPVCHEENRKAS